MIQTTETLRFCSPTTVMRSDHLLGFRLHIQKAARKLSTEPLFLKSVSVIYIPLHHLSSLLFTFSLLILHLPFFLDFLLLTSPEMYE